MTDGRGGFVSHYAYGQIPEILDMDKTSDLRAAPPAHEQPLPRQVALQAGLRVWAEVDLDVIEANVRGLCQRAGEARLLAVVKGNAYGHGAIAVARAAMAGGAWGLGVVSLEEGEELRRAGIEAPILVLGSSSLAMARRLVAADLRVTVASLAEGKALSAAATAVGREVRLHIKVETGLNRFGVLPDAAVALAEALRELPGVVVEGLSTHLASVDEGDKSFTFEQQRAFQRGAERLPWVPLHHIASTGGLLDLPELRLAMVRCGIGVYGYYPSDEVSRSVALRPALALRSRIARVSRGRGRRERRLRTRLEGSQAQQGRARHGRLRGRRAPRALQPRLGPGQGPSRAVRRPCGHGHAHGRRHATCRAWPWTTRSRSLAPRATKASTQMK